jgi:hypothetical protein
MVIGLRNGRTEAQNKTAKEKTYSVVGEPLSGFNQRNVNISLGILVAKVQSFLFTLYHTLVPLSLSSFHLQAYLGTLLRLMS